MGGFEPIFRSLKEVREQNRVCRTALFLSIPYDSSEQAAQFHALRLRVEGFVGDLHLAGHNVGNFLPT